jgi:transposase InsO family protein
LRIRIRDLAQARVRYGYRRLHVLLLREGWRVNHKRVYRLYKEEGLSLRLKSKKKRVSAARVESPAPQAPNEVWSMDFVSDSLGNGQAIRALTLVDNFSRVSPAIEVDFSLTGKRVVEVLERVRSRYGQPQVIKCDNVLTRKSSTRFGNTPPPSFNLLALASAASELKNLRPLARRAPRVLDFCLASAQGQLQGSFRSPD